VKEPEPLRYAIPQAGLCNGLHRTWPIAGKERRQAGADTLCLRCGAIGRRVHIEPLGVVAFRGLAVGLG